MGARLEAQRWQVRDVELIANPHSDAVLVFPRFGAVFTKLRAWEMTDIGRIVLLDADTLVLRNVDDLFMRLARCRTGLLSPRSFQLGRHGPRAVEGDVRANGGCARRSEL